MKPNTVVHAAFKNVGDSTTQGDYMVGELKEVIMWLVQKLGAASMKNRFVIGIGRDEAGAMIAIQDKRTRETKSAEVVDDLRSMLDGMLSEMGSEEPDSPAEREMPKTIPGDDYQA